MRWPGLWAVGALLIALAGCTEPASEDPLLVLTAASTTDAMTEAAALFEEATDVRVRVSAAGSNTLAQQVVAGVGADLFLSANPHWVDVVERAGAVRARTPLLTNTLVIAVGRNNDAAPRTPADLLAPTVAYVALAGERVPAGRYAQAALDDAGVLQPLLEGKRVARGEDVRLTLGYLEAGEAQAAVVYATDALASDRVKVAYRFPAQSHPPIRYPLVRLSDRDAAKALFDFLQSDTAGRVFERHGFTLVAPPAS